MAPVGGREAREKATAPLHGVTDPDMGGQFNNKNPGKRGISLNVRHPKGLEIAQRLVAMSDIVAEGFSPGVLDNWGLGYDSAQGDQARHHLRAAVRHGRAGHLRPLPHRRARSPMRSPASPRCRACPSRRCPPAGAIPISTGWAPTASRSPCCPRSIIASAPARASGSTPRRPRSASSSAAPPILDWSANGRIWTRYGNRSPYKPAAPHGAYPCAGEDRWLAIACFTDAEWRALCEVAGHPEWARDDRFATLAGRLANQDALDAHGRRLDATATTPAS